MYAGTRGCHQRRGPEVPERLRYIVAADVPTRTGNTDGGDDRGVSWRGAQKPLTQSPNGPDGAAAWNLTDRLELVLRIYDRLPEGDK